MAYIAILCTVSASFRKREGQLSWSNIVMKAECCMALSFPQAQVTLFRFME